MSMSKEMLLAVASYSSWLEMRPDIENFDAIGDVAVTYHGERIGVFKDLDGWWEYFHGQ